MTVATQNVFAHTDALVETWDLGAATPQNTLVQQEGSERLGVTLTDTIGVTKPAKTIYGSVTINGITQPGVGNDEALSVSTDGFAAGVAIDGTWKFPVAGATVDIAQGTPVYFDPTAGTLSLTDDGVDDVRAGVVNYTATYAKAAGVLPVKIGA